MERARTIVVVAAATVVSGAYAQGQLNHPVPIFAQHNVTFEENDRKVVLHWMATPQSWAQGIKITCRLANPKNRAILFEWDGIAPGDQPAIGRIELGAREQSMLLGLRGDRQLPPWRNYELVTCNATGNRRGGLKYSGNVSLTEVQLVLGEEGNPAQLRVRVHFTLMGHPDKPLKGVIRCALLRGSALQEVVEFPTATEPNGGGAIVELPLVTGNIATGVNCVDAWPRRLP